MRIIEDFEQFTKDQENKNLMQTMLDKLENIEQERWNLSGCWCTTISVIRNHKKKQYIYV